MEVSSATPIVYWQYPLNYGHINTLAPPCQGVCGELHSRGSGQRGVSERAASNATRLTILGERPGKTCAGMQRTVWGGVGLVTHWASLASSASRISSNSLCGRAPLRGIPLM